MKKENHNINIALKILLSTIMFLLLSACSDIYDNVLEYADGETIYADRLDGIIRVQTGFERVEIDLMEAGRIPASQINMGKATKTVIECPDFPEEGNRRVIDSICSWVNITGLTELKTYQFTIYTEDDYGNRSLPLKAEGRPFTQENVEALGIASPVVVESSATALIEWKEPLSTRMYTVYRYNYEYTDRDGGVHNGGDEGDLPSFFVENIVKGTNVPVKLRLRTIPSVMNTDGTYTPILDTIWWEPTIMLRVSENAQPAIFLKEPRAATPIDINNTGDVFPLTFSWTTLPEVNEYILKISGDPSFPDTEETRKLNVGSIGEYILDEATWISIINSFPKSRLKELYWTVTPVDQGFFVTTQTRTILASRSPQLIGKWTFDNPTNLGEAQVGNDLILEGSGFTLIDGENHIIGDKAVKIDKGSYFKCLPDFSLPTGNYTFMAKMKYSDTGAHALLQTDLTNTDAAEFMINENGSPGVEGIGYAPQQPSILSIGPGSWNRIFVIAEDNTYKLYVNGELTYTGGSSNPRYLLDSEGFLMFADGSGKDNAVEVSEVALWDLALSEEEMLLYNNLKLVDRRELSIPNFTAHTSPGLVTQIIDGNLAGTPWYASGVAAPLQITIDLGKTRDIGSVVLYTSTWAAANYKTIQLQTGMNQTLWDTVGELTRGGASPTPWGGIAGIEFPEELNARYLKVIIKEFWGSMAALGEVKIYEKAN